MDNALVFVSIILGIAVAFEVEHLDKLIRSKRVTWHWAQPLFALFVILTIMAIWWILAGKENQQAVTFADFLPIMLILVTLNLLAAVSLPGTIPEEGLDLGKYYQENRRYMWGLYMLFMAPTVIFWLWNVATKVRSVEEFQAHFSFDIVMFGIFLFLFFARNWWHVALGYCGVAWLASAWLSRTI